MRTLISARREGEPTLTRARGDDGYIVILRDYLEMGERAFEYLSHEPPSLFFSTNADLLIADVLDFNKICSEGTLGALRNLLIDVTNSLNSPIPAIWGDFTGWVSSSKTINDLTVAAEIDNEEEFIRLASKIDLSKWTSDEYLIVIRQAIRAGAHSLARQLAISGEARFPNQSELHEAAVVLGPPEIIDGDRNPRRSIKLNRDWLKQNALEYKGQWVALRDGQISESSGRLADLKESLQEEPRNYFITRVPN